MIGDSLTSFGGNATADALAGVGWTNPIVDAFPNRRIDFHSELDLYDGLGAVDAIRDRSGDSQYWIIDLGTNDIWVDFGGDHASLIRQMLQRIGPGHRVLWVNVHFPGSRELENEWNSALATVDAESEQMTVFDWASLADEHPEWMSIDMIHHSAEGLLARASAIAAASLRMLEPLPPGGTGASALGGLVPVGPKRVLDTRVGDAAAGGSVTQVPLSAVVPAGTMAVAINLTAVGSVSGGFATAFPCSSGLPSSSTVNFAESGGAPQSSAAIVSVDEHGELCVFVSVATHLVVDLSGAFVIGVGIGMASVPPRRLLDTRTSAPGGVLEAQTTTRVHTPVVNGAVIVNLTADEATGNGYITAWPCAQGTQPTASNLNVIADEGPRANASLVPIGADGDLCIYNQAPTAIIVDLLGVFAPGKRGRFQPVRPARVLDTRSGIGGSTGGIGAGQTIRVELSAVPAGAIAVGTLTVTGATGSGYVTAWDGVNELPPTSNLNYRKANVRSNLFATATVATPTGAAIALSVPTLGRPQAIVDLTGWFVVTG
ncbi:MAG: hypothetical protein ABIP99_00485 [Ilumatobacteraceae bacterium]